MDAGIASWYQKFKFDSIRPISAIRSELAGTQVNSWLGPNKGYGMVDGSKWLPYQHVHGGDAAVPGVHLRALDVQPGRGADPAVVHRDRHFGAYVTIEKDSSKFEANTPTTDIVFTWPTFTNVGDDSGLFTPDRRDPLRQR